MVTLALAGSPRAGSNSAPLLTAILVLPAPLLLGGIALTSRVQTPLALWIGCGVTFVLAVGLLRIVSSRPLRSPLLGLPCAFGSVALWLSRPPANDALTTGAMGLMVLLPSVLFGWYALLATGGPARRRACRIAAKLVARTDWPATLDACRQLPEVADLRDAIRDEAAPALALLADPRPNVGVAALAALEFRKSWHSGQPDAILSVVKSAPQPELRAAAVLALGGMRHRLVIEELAESLRDPAPAVRRAAVEALLWDCERRWPWVRHAVHETLGDPRFHRDGPLAPRGRFSPQAISDLAAWTTEAGSLGQRATQTLALHYGQRLTEGSDPQLLQELRDLVGNARGSAILRIELAHLLQKYNQFTPELLERMLDPANPSPLRLMAIEALLQTGARERTLPVLRQIARQPNRELAMHAAVVVQKYLHIDLGLELGRPTPALHTRQAADVTRRVIQWATDGTTTLSTEAPRPRAESKHAQHDLQLPPAADDSVTVPPPPEQVAPLEWD